MNNNNSFSRYVKYIPNQNLTPFSNFILVFDLTITSVHTDGTPRVHPMDGSSGRSYIGYIHNYFEEDFKSLKDFLKKYSKYYNIYINSRGVSDMIVEYLSSPFIDIFQYISGVYGAKDVTSISPYRVNPEDIWANIKVNVNKKIQTLNNLDSESKIIFFDDTDLNITRSKENNFSNSYLVVGTHSLQNKIRFFEYTIEMITNTNKRKRNNNNNINNNKNNKKSKLNPNGTKNSSTKNSSTKNSNTNRIP